jgi:hypothetical protein
MANSPATIFNTLLPLPAILMMGGQEMTKRNVDDTRCGRRSRPAVIGLLFNQLSAYLFVFQESVSTGLLSRIVLNNGINSNSSLYP